MDTQKLVQEIIDTLIAGGEFAMESYRQQQQVDQKADLSWVTATDLAVEQMVIERLTGLVPKALFVGEESTEEWTPEIVDRIFQADYVWSVDPIDGTANYVNHFGEWAVSIGLLRNTAEGLVPWLGGVYYPRQDRILYSDGEQSYEMERAASPSPLLKPLPVRTYDDIGIVRLKTFPINANKFKRWDTRGLRNVRVFGSTVVHLGGIAIGSAAGSLTRGHLWDIAGSMAILQPLGVQLFDPKTHLPLAALKREYFNFDPQKGFWNLHQDYLVAHPSAVPFLLELLKRRS